MGGLAVAGPGRAALGDRRRDLPGQREPPADPAGDPGAARLYGQDGLCAEPCRRHPQRAAPDRRAGRAGLCNALTSGV